MKAILENFREIFDYVIIDSPPLNAVTDASVLAAVVDGALLVVEQGRTSYTSLSQAKASLERVSARILGVVINKLRAGASSYYYYDYGYYGESQGVSAKSSQARLSSDRRPAKQAGSPIGRKAFGGPEEQAASIVADQAADPTTRPANGSADQRVEYPSPREAVAQSQRSPVPESATLRAPTAQPPDQRDRPDGQASNLGPERSGSESNGSSEMSVSRPGWGEAPGAAENRPSAQNAPPAGLHAPITPSDSLTAAPERDSPRSKSHEI